MVLKTGLVLTIGLFSVNVQTQECNNKVSADIQLSGRLCLDGQCLDSAAFQTIKVGSLMRNRTNKLMVIEHHCE